MNVLCATLLPVRRFVRHLVGFLFTSSMRDLVLADLQRLKVVLLQLRAEAISKLLWVHLLVNE